MPKTDELTRHTAIEEMKQLGFPSIVTPLEMAKNAGRWGVICYEPLVEMGVPSTQLMYEAYRALEDEDLQKYYDIRDQFDSLNKETSDDLDNDQYTKREEEFISNENGKMYSLFNAIFDEYDVDIAASYYSTLAMYWLNENANRIDEGLFAYARILGINHNIPDKLDLDSLFNPYGQFTPYGLEYLRQRSDIKLRLFKEFSTFNDTLGGVWRLKENTELPDWIAVIFGMPNLLEINSPEQLLKLQTGHIAAHMQEFVIKKSEKHHVVKEYRYNGRDEQISLSSSIEVKASDDMVENIFNGIMKRKNSQSTHLLKLHLDLCDQAARRGGENPIIWYDLHAAAARMGYSKIPGRDSYDQKTLREIYERIKTLKSFQIHIGKIGKGKKSLHIATNYWRIGDSGIEEKDIPIDEEGNLVDINELLNNKISTIPRIVEIQPGSWWGELIQTQYLNIPSDLLKLPIDGKGNERNRMAIEICATLAIWERSGASHQPSQNKTIGAILSSANIVTLDELKSNKHAVRIKENFLAAMEIVRRVGGFDIEYIDENADAMGRGWHTLFWNARIRLTARPINGVNTGQKIVSRRAEKK